MNIENQIKAYKEILKVAKKYEADIKHDVYCKKGSLEVMIRNLQLSQRFGIPLKYPSADQGSYYEVENSYDNWTGISFCREGAVGCSDDRSQPTPEGEWLYVIRFTCGAYIFGDEYPIATFRDMFDELKSYGPAFVDSSNKSLYFRDDVAHVVHENFWPIFKKYKALVAEELKAKRKQALIDELSKLDGE